MKRAFDYVFDIPAGMTDRTLHIYSDETVPDRQFTIVVTREPVSASLTEEDQIMKAIGQLSDSFPEFSMMRAQWRVEEHGRFYMCEFSWRSERGPMTQYQVYFSGQKDIVCATFSRLGAFTREDQATVLRYMRSFRQMPERFA